MTAFDARRLKKNRHLALPSSSMIEEIIEDISARTTKECVLKTTIMYDHRDTELSHDISQASPH